MIYPALCGDYPASGIIDLYADRRKYRLHHELTFSMVTCGYDGQFCAAKKRADFANINLRVICEVKKKYTCTVCA